MHEHLCRQAERIFPLHKHSSEMLEWPLEMAQNVADLLESHSSHGDTAGGSRSEQARMHHWDSFAHV